MFGRIRASRVENVRLVLDCTGVLGIWCSWVAYDLPLELLLLSLETHSRQSLLESQQAEIVGDTSDSGVDYLADDGSDSDAPLYIGIGGMSAAHDEEMAEIIRKAPAYQKQGPPRLAIILSHSCGDFAMKTTAAKDLLENACRPCCRVESAMPIAKEALCIGIVLISSWLFVSVGETPGLQQSMQEMARFARIRNSRNTTVGFIAYPILASAVLSLPFGVVMSVTASPQALGACCMQRLRSGEFYRANADGTVCQSPAALAPLVIVGGLIRAFHIHGPGVASMDLPKEIAKP